MRGASSADYYLDLAQEDYYLKGGEPPGHWYGEGAESLGLFGKVTESELKLLIVGRGPDKEALVQNAGDGDRQGGWDLTFPAPKSVSVLWAQADPVTRRAIQEAHGRAVDAALNYLEAEAGRTRRGKGGAEKEPAKLVFARFDHGTSRAQDPAIHTHALLMNIGIREDGSTGSIESKPIFQNKMTAGAIYRAQLAYDIGQIGFEVERKRSWFEVKGVSEELVSEQSKRRKAIKEKLEEWGEKGAKASKFATLSTREKKEHLPRELLFGLWAHDGERHNFTASEVQKLKELGQARTYNKEEEKKEAVANTLNKLTEKESHFSRRDFIRHMAEEAQGRGLSAKDVLETVEKELKNSREIVHLGRFKDEERYSTRSLVALEKGMLERVKEGLEKTQTVRDESLAKVFSVRTLSDEQKAAAKHLTQNPGSVQLLAGMAGTGKSYVMDSVRDAYEKDGYRVLGAAPSGKAAAELEASSGIKSKTVHRLLGEVERGEVLLDKKTVLIVDEAAMLGTKKMAELVEVTHSRGAKLILVGDEKQLQSVAAGGAFTAFSETLGRKELTDIRRQKEEWARTAVHNFASGRSEEALSEYAKRGLVTVANTRKLAIDSVITDWKKEGTENPKANLIITGTNLDAHELNARAQAARFREGKIQGEGIAAGNEHFYQGDRVIFRENNRALKVTNGLSGTIDSVDTTRGTFKATLDSGVKVEIDPAKYEKVKLGYAITTHSGQGATAERAFVLLGGNMQDRELSYVQASRAKDATRFYVDKNSSGEKLTEIMRQMSVSHKKDLAITIGKGSQGIAAISPEKPKVEPPKHRHRMRQGF